MNLKRYTKTHLAILSWLRSYKKLGQYQTAINDYTKVIQLDPNNVTSYSNRGHAYTSLGQDQNAINDLTKAIQLDPTYASAYGNRGNVYHNLLGQYQLAIDDFTKAIQFEPSALRYANRGISYRALGQPALADADKTMACSLDSQYC